MHWLITWNQWQKIAGAEDDNPAMNLVGNPGNPGKILRLFIA